MIPLSQLKNILHRGLGRSNKLLVVLFAVGEPIDVAAVRRFAREAGLREVKDWNVSDILRSSKGRAVLTHAGWELTDDGRTHVAELLSLDKEAKPPPAANALRAELAKIKDPTTQAFAEEAVLCFEHKLFRSAIVMSWLAGVDILYRHVVANELAAFNTEATRVFGTKWKTAKNADDLALMGERDFLDRLAHLSIIGKNVKTELVKCLDLRNGCGHPNSLKTGPSAVAHHIEVIIQNIFQRFT